MSVFFRFQKTECLIGEFSFTEIVQLRPANIDMSQFADNKTSSLHAKKQLYFLVTDCRRR
ncbi:hypothetical protein ALTERO38_50343 [Alteromonas sp. 38]|nr:hypothetical protein ALTER154_80928 [Alteromonas sp. 154]VXB29634.1 hypothetical protein ALTERO38_50343 [Alteromonas sp. 38]